MAKVQTLAWKPFFEGNVKRDKPMDTKQKAVLLFAAGTSLAVCGFLAAHAIPHDPVAIAAFAQTALAPSSFSAQMHAATAPIRELIRGAAHEIYFIFMSWGAIEAIIGKPQQGFARMKTATLGYVLLFWVPWIIDRVGEAAAPMMGR